MARFSSRKQFLSGSQVNIVRQSDSDFKTSILRITKVGVDAQKNVLVYLPWNLDNSLSQQVKLLPFLQSSKSLPRSINVFLIIFSQWNFSVDIKVFHKCHGLFTCWNKVFWWKFRFFSEQLQFQQSKFSFFFFINDRLQQVNKNLQKSQYRHQFWWL